MLIAGKLMKHINKYYTIVELLVAFVIIAILMSISIGVYSLIFDKINESKTKSLVRKLEMAMRSYRHEVGYYFQQSSYAPLVVNEDDVEFRKLLDYTSMKSNDEINSSGQVIDAWGNPIMYRCPGEINTTLFDIGSSGKSCAWGIDDDATVDSTNFGRGDDITNTNM
jgi:type II secretory pathway pseudopilin PulG